MKAFARSFRAARLAALSSFVTACRVAEAGGGTTVDCRQKIFLMPLGYSMWDDLLLINVDLATRNEEDNILMSKRLMDRRSDHSQ